MNLLPAVVGVAYARANWGRWCVDCPRCTSALALRPGAPVFDCWDCGARADIAWPSFTHDVERLLAMRPDVTTRNWEPGETLHDLLAENMAHGVMPLPLDGGGTLLTILGDRIIRDALPAAHTRVLIGER